MDELRSKFSSKTKMIVVNTPHNPLGKVFTELELEGIAALCREFDVVALMDEVYERTVFKGRHVRMATLPGMWERTITVGSAGKSFSVTGEIRRRRNHKIPDKWFPVDVHLLPSRSSTFVFLGWHIGWTYGPKHLIGVLQRVHEFAVNSCPNVVQEAVAVSIENETDSAVNSSSFWTELPVLLEKRKNRICSTLTRAGFRVFEPNAGYFVVADFENYRKLK